MSETPTDSVGDDVTGRITAWRLIVTLLIALLGAGAFVYGALFHIIVIGGGAAAGPAALSGTTDAGSAVGATDSSIEMPEPQVVHDVTVAAIVRLADGEIEKPATDQPAAACPT